MVEDFNLNDPGLNGNNQQETSNKLEEKVSLSDKSGIATENKIDNNIRGLSEQEVQNPDAIVVTVSDPKTPVIVLFGARASGKTMTLIRLTKFLEGQGYNVVPDPIFRPDRDTHYKRMCNEFGTLVHSDYAASGNDVMSFMLVKVIAPNGRTLCQILEAPGEHYFDADYPGRAFPAYIERICAIPNRKTWLFIVEENWGGSQGVRDLYAKKIQQMQRRIRPQDKIIFTCHKVDQSVHFRPNGRPDVSQIFQNIKNQYPHIFDRYANRNPLTKWAQPYNFEFVTFSAGTFNPTGDGRQVYTPGEDYYPDQLWDALKRNI